MKRICSRSCCNVSAARVTSTRWRCVRYVSVRPHASTICSLNVVFCSIWCVPDCARNRHPTPARFSSALLRRRPRVIRRARHRCALRPVRRANRSTTTTLSRWRGLAPPTTPTTSTRTTHNTIAPTNTSLRSSPPINGPRVCAVCCCRAARRRTCRTSWRSVALGYDKPNRTRHTGAPPSATCSTWPWAVYSKCC